MGNLQRAGVEAVFETGKFAAGVAAYIRGLDNAIKKTYTMASTMNRLAIAASINVRPITNITGQLGRASIGMTNASTSLAALTSHMRQMAAAGQTIPPVMAQAGNSITRLDRSSRGTIGSIRDLLTVMAGFRAIGFSVDLLRDLGRALLDGARHTVGVIAAYEQLGFSIDSLVRREERLIASSPELTAAFGNQGASAQELLGWIQKLAIESPFSEKGIADAFQTAITYNFLTREAQTLTKVLTDFAAATGRSELQIDRVALALGQMRSAGRVLGTELRQLSEAGVPAIRILNEMGFTLEDVRDSAVGANEFIKAVVETLNRDFAGAAKRQMFTLSGIANSLQDIMDITLRGLFGPAIKTLTPDLASLVSVLRSMIPVAQQVGIELGRFVGSFFGLEREAGRASSSMGKFSEGAQLVIRALKAGTASIITFVAAALTIGAIAGVILTLANPLIGIIALLGTLTAGLAAGAGAVVFFWEDIKRKTDSILKRWGTDTYTFGYNIILMFANGLASGIGAVVSVLNSLAATFAFWLSPGSPPRILPDLVEWGHGAGNEWLRGWLKMDFDLLEGIADPIESFLRSLGEDVIGVTDVIPRILGMREAIRTAIDEFVQLGSVSEESFQKIFNSIGISEPVLQAYVRSMVELEAANKAVAEAQDELNEIQERYLAILDPIDEELRAIEEERQDFIDSQRKMDLQAILNDPFAPAEAKRLAAMELREIALKDQRRGIVNNQTAEEKAAEERLKQAQEARDLVLQQMEAQRAQIALMTENNNLIKEQLRLLESLLEKAKAGGGEQDPVPTFEPIDFGGLGLEHAQDAMKSTGGLLQNLKDKLNELLEPFRRLQGQFEQLAATAMRVWGEIKTLFRVDELMDAIARGDWTAVGGILGNALGRIVAAVVGTALSNRDLPGVIVLGVAIAIGKAIVELQRFHNAFGLLFVAGLITGIIDGAKGEGATENLLRMGRGFIESVGKAFATGPGPLATATAEWATSVVGGFTDYFWNSNEFAQDLIDVGTGIYDGVAKGISDAVALAGPFVAEELKKFVEFWRLWLKLDSPSRLMAEEIGAPIVAGLYKGIADAWPQFLIDVGARLEEMKTAFTAKVTEILAWISAPERKTEAVNAINNVVQGLIDGANSTENARKIREGFIAFVQGAIDAVLWLLGERSPSKVFMDIGSNTMLGMALGIEKSGDVAVDAMKSAVKAVIRAGTGISMPLPDFASPPQTDPFYVDPPVTGPPYNTNPPVSWTDWILRYVNGRIVEAIPPSYGRLNPIANPYQTDPFELISMLRRKGPRPEPMPMPLPLRNTLGRSNVGYLGPPSQGGGGVTGPLAQFGDTHIHNGMEEAIWRAKSQRMIANSIRGIG